MVELQFTDPVVKAVARGASVMKIGAWRYARTLEEVMDLMSDVPARSGVKSVVITEDVIAGIGQLQILT